MNSRHLIGIVDDDDAVRRALSRVCLAHGLESHTFGSAQHLFNSLLSGQRPDCLVLDVQMPGLDGTDIQRWLKEHKFEIPAIMMSGREDELLRARVQAPGARHYLCKPMDSSVLLSAIRDVVRPIPSRAPRALKLMRLMPTYP